MWGCGLHLFGPWLGRVAGSFEHGIEFSGSILGGVFLD